MSLQYIQNYKENLYLPTSDVFSFSAEIDDDKVSMAPSIPIASGWSPRKMSSCSKNFGSFTLAAPERANASLYFLYVVFKCLTFVLHCFKSV